MKVGPVGEGTQISRLWVWPIWLAGFLSLTAAGGRAADSSAASGCARSAVICWARSSPRVISALRAQAIGVQILMAVSRDRDSWQSPPYWLAATPGAPPCSRPHPAHTASRAPLAILTGRGIPKVHRKISPEPVPMPTISR